jgi:hypothetical protein
MSVANDRCWHISEVTDEASDFRLRGQSGLNADGPEPPLLTADRDPKRKLQ